MTKIVDIIFRRTNWSAVFAPAFSLVLICQLMPVAGTASAQSPAGVASLEDFLACQSIEKRKARYRCYDALERGDAPAAAVPPAAVLPTVSAAVATAPDAAQDRRDFGKFAYAKEKKERESLTVQIVSATKGGTGLWTFRTSDGQIWRQVNSKRVRFRSQSFEAEISKAPLGGFYFRPADQKLRLRVKRIK